jgi:hypothetical protein
MAQRAWSFEVADGEFDDGVLAVFGLDDSERVGAVGRKCVVLPGRQELALAIESADAANDQAPPAQRRLGDLRDGGGRVVGQRAPGALVDLLDHGGDGGLEAHADRELPAGAMEAIKRRV